jgi:tRNA G18 (ribose-2'-O)-methylase SpoU
MDPMPKFEHLRHKPPRELARPRELVLACPQLRSNVNLSRIVRSAGCCGVRRIYACGRPKVDREVARDAADAVEIVSHRSLPPVLKTLKEEGYALVGLEQTTNSEPLYDFAFPRKTVLVIGHERQGLTADVLAQLDHVVEIPVYGKPFAHNVATATAMALYEYCRQYPDG